MKEKITISNILFCSILLLFVAFFIVPFCYGIYISFTNWSGSSQDYDFVGFKNYVYIFTDKRVLNSILVSFNYAAILLPISLIFGYLNAKVLHLLRKTRSAALFVSFLPYMITPVVVSLLFSQLYYRFFISIGEAWNIEFLKTNLLANPKYALYAVAFVDLWMLVPFTTLLFFSAIDSIPISLVNVAKLDGAKNLRVFWNIKYPYLLPTIGIIIIIILTHAFTNIDTIMSLTSGGPGRTTETFFYIIYRSSTVDAKYGLGAAQGITVAAFCIIVYMLISKITSGKRTSDISLED